MPSQLLEKYAQVMERLQNARLRAGTAEVKLVAVSKFHGSEEIAQVASAGQLDFGENYVQEAAQKMGALSNPALRWHMIGHVQSRKAKEVAGQYALVHTLASSKLADAFEKRLREVDKTQPVLLEINLAGEKQKSGILPEQAPELAEYILANCPRIELEGLMCIPPFKDAGAAAKPWFAKLRKLRDHLERQTGKKLPQLSMGMSEDFEEAIAEGATIVRVGTAIFGPRPSRLSVRLA